MNDLIKAAQEQSRQQHLDENWRQVILVRRDLNMSPGKLAAQVAHGSMAFITNYISYNSYDTRWKLAPSFEEEKMSVPMPWYLDLFRAQSFKTEETENRGYHILSSAPLIDEGLMQGWFEGSFTKIVLGVDNLKELESILFHALQLGFKENVDFFYIRDNCLTELEPEGADGTTLTVVGFRPMPKATIDKVTGGLHLL